MNDALSLIRSKMDSLNIGFLIIPNTDPHMSEYVGDHYKVVEYVSGFTGSNATVVISQNEAGLWTDGRYFEQAERELKGSGITMYKLSTPNEPTVEEYIESRLGDCKKRYKTIGFEGDMLTKKEYDGYLNLAKNNKAKLVLLEDFFGDIWVNRPQRTANPIFILSDEHSGQTTAEKVDKLRGDIKKAGADAFVSNNLCEIAWLLNLRGKDVETVLVFYSYLYLDERHLCLFLQRDSLSKEVIKYLKSIKGSVVKLFWLEDAYKKLKRLKNKRILADETIINKSLDMCLSKHNEMIYKASPIEKAKAIKNPVEIENTKKAHLDDSLAVTRFIYGIKNHCYEEENLTEDKVCDILHNLRAVSKDFLSDSFSTIAAYGANAAMMHYSPSKTKPVAVKKKGFLLVDSGGHYMTGTTDVTRTIAMGELTEDEKYYYTKSLKSHLALMGAVFKHGATGATLDMLARKEFWKEGIDYLCGTGHGVGHILSVHEGPQNIGYRLTKVPAVIEPGMIVTDEPGYYEEGAFGIRIENELLCQEYRETYYGKFLCFLPLTWVPYEREAILEEQLSEEEKEVFNKYNKMVYEKLKDSLNEAESRWLLEVTSEIR